MITPISNLEFKLEKVLNWDPLERKKAIVNINKRKTFNFRTKNVPKHIKIYIVKIVNPDGFTYNHYLACSEYQNNGRIREHKEKYDHFPERKELKTHFKIKLS